jgi:hypothetical protein
MRYFLARVPDYFEAAGGADAGETADCDGGDADADQEGVVVVGGDLV